MCARRDGADSSTNNWRRFLGLNASTFALLGAILLITASTELWSPLVPQYLKELRRQAQKGDPWFILLIGLYGFYRDGLEAINYYVGGAIGGWLNTRRALLLFNILPLVGLTIILLWRTPLAVFVAIPFIFVWDSIAGPATLTVVGDAIPPDRRTMAFSLQAIFRRVSRILAYSISGFFVWRLGSVGGVRADIIVSIVLILAAVAMQARFMQTASRDAQMTMHRPRHLLKQFPTDLKRLLAADIFARWAEGLAGPFIILYCVPILSADLAKGAALYQSLLLNIQAAVNILLYLIIGPLASREGLVKRPYIGLTFVFFALFPLSIALLGPAFGMIGLVMAFVIGGMREIGEPARKAMIADLVPPDVKTQAIGLYWSVRSAAVMWASPVGAIAWIVGERFHPSAGPLVTFGLAGIIGLFGAVAFFASFGRREAANRIQP